LITILLIQKIRVINMGKGSKPVCPQCCKRSCECKEKKPVINSAEKPLATIIQEAATNSTQEAATNSTQEAATNST
jgi:hypothetical protein